MSVTGFWFVQVMSDARVADLESLRAASLLAERDPAIQAAWQTWLAHPEGVAAHDTVEGTRMRRLNAASEAYLSLFWRMPWQHSTFLEGRGGEPAPDDLAQFATRKLPPTSLLFHGLGPERARLQPGFLCDFLLSARELAAAHIAIASAFDLPMKERARVLDRMRAWLTVGDEPKADVAACLDLLPRMVDHALATGRGICSINLCF